MRIASGVSYHPSKVAIRLMAIMEHWGLSNAAFGRSIGVSGSTVGNWVKQQTQVPEYGNVEEIVRVYGVPSDWIYFGRADSLPEHLREPLVRLEDRIRIRGSRGRPKRSASSKTSASDAA